MPNFTDIVILVVLAILLGGALLYIRKEKKRGVRCIGCPSAGACSKQKNGGCKEE